MWVIACLLSATLFFFFFFNLLCYYAAYSRYPCWSVLVGVAMAGSSFFFFVTGYV